MDSLYFSFIIPVYNRPVEIEELLVSFSNFEKDYNFEIVIIEDGSTNTSEHVINKFKGSLNISYYFKENSGPGDSRNYGMQKAKGNYFIILDSDVILPKDYLTNVISFLNRNYYDCFGGPDAAHESFSNLQKAINFSMTSFLTTGGIRGGKNQVEDFQPRSFNMGLSKKAFIDSNGFGNIHPGEDPDLSLRLKKLGYKTVLIRSAYVYHKRRISWNKFYQQVNKFGLVRPILNSWHPDSKSVVYWFPSLFSLGFLTVIILGLFGLLLPIFIYGLYFFIAFVMATITNKSIIVGFQSVVAICVQFFGYGFGFIRSIFFISLMKQQPEEKFPKLFF